MGSPTLIVPGTSRLIVISAGVLVPIAAGYQSSMRHLPSQCASWIAQDASN
jgi:hypothetical protein